MSQQSTALSDFEKPASSGGSKTIQEFCDDNRISRSFYYKMRRAGVGPDEMRYGTVVRITHRAEAIWQQRGESAVAIAASADNKQKAATAVTETAAS
jgi:hypothetical protein